MQYNRCCVWGFLFVYFFPLSEQSSLAMARYNSFWSSECELNQYVFTAAEAEIIICYHWHRNIIAQTAFISAYFWVDYAFKSLVNFGY